MSSQADASLDEAKVVGYFFIDVIIASVVRTVVARVCT